VSKVFDQGQECVSVGRERAGGDDAGGMGG